MSVVYAIVRYLFIFICILIKQWIRVFVTGTFITLFHAEGWWGRWSDDAGSDNSNHYIVYKGGGGKRGHSGFNMSMFTYWYSLFLSSENFLIVKLKRRNGIILKDPDGINIMLSFVAFLLSGYGEPILQYVLIIKSYRQSSSTYKPTTHSNHNLVQYTVHVHMYYFIWIHK